MSRDAPDTTKAAEEAAPAQPDRPALMHLYLDDSGSRHLDKNMANPDSHPRWFALGGVLVREEDEASCKTAYDAFVRAWPQIRSPLHISDMRSERKGFKWLERLGDDERSRFWSEYRAFLSALPVAGVACVIDRPGYAGRGYGKREGDKKWLLCRSAFDIVVERSAKVAALEKRRLRVRFEGADPTTDARIEDYFRQLKQVGLGFDQANSEKYAPMPADDLAAVLIDLERKDKRNRMMQIADTFVYALALGGYNRKFDIFRRLLEHGRLVTSQVPSELAPQLGIKYYCFDHR